MQSTAEVTAADIARIAGVGRAAVSNWRKRFDDFPPPVGGTAASPTFRLSEVERWLTDNSRLPEQSPQDRLWRTLQHGSADLERDLPAIAHALLDLHRNGAVDARDATFVAVAQAAEEIGVEKAMDFLFDRYIELRGRRGSVTTSSQVADLMAELAMPAGKTVLDPACRTGAVLAAAAARGAASVYGQDSDSDHATMAAARLGITATDSHIRHGTLRDDAFPQLRVDVVLSDPPTGGNWGFDELAADVRWEYSLPPRSEAELAAVQHALARLKPGGIAILLLPPGVAERTAGRRVRRELLRRGALRMVIALPSGATSPHNMRLHLWVLRRPDDQRAARDVLMIDAEGTWLEAAKTIREALSLYSTGHPLTDELAGRAVVAETVNLISEEIDLTPSRHIATGQSGLAADVIAERCEQLKDLLRSLAGQLPAIPPGDPVSTASGEQSRADVSVGELVKVGIMALHAQADVVVQVGDVLVPAVGPQPRMVVATKAQAGQALGPQHHLVRVDSARLDPWFLAGHLGVEANLKRITSMGSIPRVDVRKAHLPRLPIERQRSDGRMFRALREFEDILRSAATTGEEVVHLMTEGLAHGTLSSEA